MDERTLKYAQEQLRQLRQPAMTGSQYVEKEDEGPMSREAEIIKEIDEHIKKAGGLYGLELPDSDLQVIWAALKKRIQVSANSVTLSAQSEERTYEAYIYRCPACGIERIYFSSFPSYCDACGQALRKEGGDPLGEE